MPPAFFLHSPTLNIMAFSKALLALHILVTPGSDMCAISLLMSKYIYILKSKYYTADY